MRILVTGCAGFIGHAVATRLLFDGHTVFGLDNLNDYYDPALKRARLSRLESSPFFHFRRVDLANADALGAWFEEAGPETVVHLAAQAGVRYSLVNPNAYVQSNLMGFANLLECCRRRPPRHLVYASSSSVYGASRRVPFALDDPADTPISFYAATKRANEHMAYSYSHLHGIPATGLRLFTVYGPWGRPDMAYYEFTRRMLAGESITLYADGEPQRDFTYIDDIVAGIKAALGRAPARENGVPHRLFNLGNDRPARVRELIALLEGFLGVEARVESRELPPSDVMTTWADIAESRRVLGYEPRIRLEEGLRRFVDWYRDYHKVPSVAAS